jgi:hypothetical protein
MMMVVVRKRVSKTKRPFQRSLTLALLRSLLSLDHQHGFQEEAKTARQQIFSDRNRLRITAYASPLGFSNRQVATTDRLLQRQRIWDGDGGYGLGEPSKGELEGKGSCRRHQEGRGPYELPSCFRPCTKSSPRLLQLHSLGQVAFAAGVPQGQGPRQAASGVIRSR